MKLLLYKILKIINILLIIMIFIIEILIQNKIQLNKNVL